MHGFGIMFSAFINKRILKYPADTRSIGTQFTLDTSRETTLYFREVFKDTASRPVYICSILENNINI